MVIDDNDRIHLVWADKSGQHKIMYTSINPYLAPLDGMAAEDTAISVIDDTIISMRAQDRDWPSIDVDSQGNLHIAWQDSYDELQQFFNQPQIYYSMIQPEFSGGSVLTLFEDTLLTPIIGHKGHPDIVVDSNDLVQIAWDDTRGGKVELVFLVDTSGSMYSEWADVCTVIYGGQFAAGGYFQGLKPMLQEGNMTVYETIYGLGNTLPGAASSGNCATHNKNAGPRATALGITPGDDSGGIRKPRGTVYNGNTYSGYSGEDWGPEPTGPASPGRMPKATSQATHRPKTTTSGTRTQQRLQSQFQMKGRKTETQHSKPTIQPPSRKHTTTVSTQASFQSVCMDKPTAVQPVFNPTSRTWRNARTVSRAQPHVTVRVTRFDLQMLEDKFTNSHLEAVVQAKCPSSSRQWFTFRPTTHVKSTCLF